MSEDEVAVSVFSSLACLAMWGWWYGSIYFRKTNPLAEGRQPPVGRALVFAPLVAALLLFVILQTVSARDVRDDSRYLFMYMVLGMAWTGIATIFPAWVGVSFRHDVLARRNRAAAWICGGWVVAVTLAFAGGNIGDGPGWYVVVFSGALATVSLAAVFIAWEILAGTNDAITIDRDASTAVRTSGMLVACGAVFGISAAGDWHSAEATVRDFCLSAWPAIFIILLAFACQVLLRPTPAKPRPSVVTDGFLPALLMCVLAGVWVAYVASRVI